MTIEDCNAICKICDSYLSDKCATCLVEIKRQELVLKAMKEMIKA